MERGQWSLDAVFDSAHDWCLANLPVEPVCLGEAQREVHAIDSSTIVRLRAGQRLALAGKGYCHRAGRAVRANIVAALTRVVMIGGVRVGLVRRTRFGSSCHEAVEHLFAELPPATGKRLMVVDAGIATKEQFAAATAQDALLGRLRINTKLRCAPAPPRGNPGRPPVHGEVLHPGRDHPEVVPDVERTLPGEAGTIRLRRWSTLHYEEFPETILDVVRIDDPAYDVPLIVGSTARDLRLEEFWSGYQHRWPVETNFFVAQDTGSHGDATGLDADRLGTTHQFGAARGDPVKGDCGGLPTAGHRAVGSQTRPICGPVGELSGPPRRAIFRTCAPRRRTEKPPKKSQQGLYKGLAATQSRVTWSNPRACSGAMTG